MLLIPAQRAQAQLIPAKKDIPTNDPGMKYGFHATAEAEHKIFPYLVANIGTEVRMQGDFLYDRQWRFHGEQNTNLPKGSGSQGNTHLSESTGTATKCLSVTGLASALKKLTNLIKKQKSHSLKGFNGLTG